MSDKPSDSYVPWWVPDDDPIRTGIPLLKDAIPDDQPLENIPGRPRRRPTPKTS